MKNDKFFKVLGDIDSDMVISASKERTADPMSRSWWRMGAVAACLVLVVAALLTFPYIPRAYALDYEYTAEDGSELEYKNMWIYYADGGKVKRERVKLPFSAENVFLTWKYLGGIGDEVELVWYMLTEQKLVPVEKEGITDSYTVSEEYMLALTVSSELEGYFDNVGKELLLASLEKTMVGYAGIEIKLNGTGVGGYEPENTEKTADSATDSVTTADDTTADDTTADDTTSDDTTSDDTTEADEPDDEPNELTDVQKTELYNALLEAKADKRYMYAYGLASLLSSYDHLDTAELRTELTAQASANYFAPAFMSEVVGENCSLADIPENAPDIEGVLYIGEGGVPHFMYYDDYDVLRDIIPDTTLDGVVSIHRNPDHLFSGPKYFQCICRDGSVRVLCEKSSRGDEPVVFAEGLSDVIKLVYEAEGDACAYLHRDGRVSLYYPYSLGEEEEKTAYDSIYKWNDAVDIRISGDARLLTAITRDGGIRYAMLDSYHKEYHKLTEPFYSYIETQNIKLSTFTFACTEIWDSYAYSKGEIYSLGENGFSFHVVNKDKGGVPRKSYVASFGCMFVNTEGTAVVDGKSLAWDGIGTVENIASFGYYWGHYYAVTTDGKLIYEDAAKTDTEYHKVLENITLYIA